LADIDLIVKAVDASIFLVDGNSQWHRMACPMRDSLEIENQLSCLFSSYKARQ
jgi:hypothetical protein